MKYSILGLILAAEIFALYNRGGGPLLSYLFLTGITFLIFLLAIKAVRKRVDVGWPHLFFWIFAVLFVVSSIFAVTQGYALAELLLAVDMAMLLLLLTNLEFEKKEINFFKTGIVAIAVIDTLIGFFIYLNNAYPRLVGTFIDFNEPYSTFGNDYADFILIILPVALSTLFINFQRRTTAVLAVISSAILFTGFLLSFSRAAWASFIVIIVIFAVWRKIHGKKSSITEINKKSLILRFTGMIVLTLLLVFGLQTVRSWKYDTISFFKKAAFQSDEGTASASERWEFWRGAGNVIKDNPIWGVGVHGFKFIYPQYQKPFGINWGQPHNIFLKIGVENGLLALIAFVAFLISAAAICIKFFWRNPSHFALVFFLGSLAALGHNMLDYNLVASNFTLFIVFGAISLSYALPSAPLLAVRGKIIFPVLFLIIFALLALSFHEAFYNINFKKGREFLAAGNLDEAVVNLEKTKNLYFERDLDNYLAKAYWRQYEKTKDPAWLEKEKKLLEAAVRTSVDAYIFSELGKIFMEQGAFANAEYYFSKAVELDPKNELKYYSQLADSLLSQEKPLPLELKRTIFALLKEYWTALKQNRHLTILTENPFYAAELYELFGMKNRKAEIERIWFNEVMKFTIKYGPVPALQ